MSKKISWLDNFAEDYAKTMSKTASNKIKKESGVLVDLNMVKNKKVGSVVKLNGKMYKVADLDYQDDKGPGAVLTEFDDQDETADNSNVEDISNVDDAIVTDPMNMAMGTEQTTSSSSGAQEYARTNPGDVYHYEIRDDVEQPAFEQAAQETAQEIEKERNFDRSTPAGHYTAPKDMNGGAGLVEDTMIPDASAPVENELVDETSEAPETTEVPEVTEEVEETTEVPEDNETPEDTDIPENTENEETTEDTEKEETPEDTESDENKEDNDEDEKLEGNFSEAKFRGNRILRRIMASK